MIKKVWVKRLNGQIIEGHIIEEINKRGTYLVDYRPYNNYRLLDCATEYILPCNIIGDSYDYDKCKHKNRCYTKNKKITKRKRLSREYNVAIILLEMHSS